MEIVHKRIILFMSCFQTFLLNFSSPYMLSFRQIYPAKIRLEYVVKSYFLDQCIDMCRICKKCLKNEACIVVGFSL